MRHLHLRSMPNLLFGLCLQRDQIQFFLQLIYFRTAFTNDDTRTSSTNSDRDQTYNVLAGTKVSYDVDLTKNDIDKLGTQKPQLIFKAFAVQVEADGRIEDPNAGSAFGAWGKVTESEKLIK